MGQEIISGLVFCLVLFSVSVKSQVVLTWNGTTVTGPVLIYHDELTVDPGPYQASYNSTYLSSSEQGALVCRSEHQVTVQWYKVNNTLVASGSEGANTNFRQLTTKVGMSPSVSRLVVSQENLDRRDAIYNGLWPCRLNDSFEGSAFVGLYRRGGGGEGGRGPVINSNNVSIGALDSQNFTLFGDTSGGPPTTYTWTRNGVPITNGGSVNISIHVNSYPQPGLLPRQNSTYQSILTITSTSILPGVYRYSASNRATPTMVSRSNITITQGTLMTVQIGIESIRISWSLSSPMIDYCIRVDSGNFSRVNSTRETSHTLTVAPGTYTVHVLSLSSNTTGAFAEGNVTVLDLLAPANIMISYLTAISSVNISWTQPEDSLPAEEYRVELTLTNMSLTTFQESRTCIITSTSLVIGSLQESSTYSVTITAVHNTFGASNETITNIALPERSGVTSVTARDVSIAVVMTLLLVTTPYTVVVTLLVWYIVRMKRANKKEAAPKDGVNEHAENDPTGYVHMTSRQVSVEPKPSLTETVYESLD